MAKPNQPRDVKPKTDDAANSKAALDGNMKMIVINLVTTVLICVLFISVNYVLQSNLLNTKLSQNKAADNATADDSEDGSADEVQRGIIVDLGDFILNLSDTAPRKYLKVNVALEVSKSPNDPDPAAQKKESKEGSKEGGEDANPVAAELAQFKPSIRDAVITTLSSKTAAELQTTPGKELAKEQISEAVNGIFAGEREVIRVSFGQFIIQ